MLWPGCGSTGMTAGPPGAGRVPSVKSVPPGFAGVVGGRERGLSHGRGRAGIHPWRRGGIFPRRSGDARRGRRPAAGDAGRVRGAAGGAGRAGVFALADRGRDAGVREPWRGAGRSRPAAAHRRRGRGAPRYGADRGGDPPVRPLGRAENHRAPALRRSTRRSAGGRSAAGDLRIACPYRHPRRRIAHRPV